MTVETLLLIFVGVTALAFTLQCLSVWWAAGEIRRLAGRLETQTREVEGKLRVVQDRLLEVSEDLRPFRTSAETLGADVSLISETVRRRADDMDQFVNELMNLGREQASKIDFLVTDTVQKFEQTTEVIQKDVLRPAVEISAFVKGIRSGLAVLFSRQKPAKSPESAEEELFI